MAWSVVLEYPVGTFTPQTEFPVGADIRVVSRNGNVLMGVVIDITWSNKTISPFHYEGGHDLFGNAEIIITLPNAVTKGAMSILEYGIFSDEVKYINIGVGTPADPTPRPHDFDLGEILKWVAIGGGVIALAWALQKSGLLSGKSKK